MERDQIVAVLESFTHGLDPATPAVISEDVVRALSAAASMLKDPLASARPRPQAAGSRWSEEEDALLCHEFDGGMPVAEIARQHGRTSNSITLRLVKLGRIDPQTVTVRERASRGSAASEPTH